MAVPNENTSEIMRILQIIPTLGPGGAEHFVFELSNELCRQGHVVELLTLFETAEDNPMRLRLDKSIKVTSLKKKLGLDPRMFYSVWQFIHRRKFDVVHGHVGAIKYMVFASMFCRKVKFVATIHSEARREAGRSIDRWTRKLMFGLKRCVPVTISDESEKSFEEFYGRKGVMIPNGVGPYVQEKVVQLRDNEKQIVFLHPASCQRVKNQELLLKGFNRLLDEGVDAKLVWVGSNETFIDLFRSLEPLMKRNVSYLGVVNNVRDYMVAADAMCLSSKMEGMPMTIIEAFSVSCVPICTPVGGCRNMIQSGGNGLLSKDLSDEAYFEVLLTYAKASEEKKQALKAAALESFKDYSIEGCAASYLRLFKGN